MAIHGNYGANPNYPSSVPPSGAYQGVKPTTAARSGSAGGVTSLFDETGDDYVQATALWNVLGRTPGQQENYVKNIAVHLSGAHKETRKTTYEMFSKVDEGLGEAIRTAIDGSSRL